MSDAPRRLIHALAASWPYRTAPFGPPVATLTRGAPGVLSPATLVLRNALEPHAQQLARGRSLATLATIIEHSWFPDSCMRLSLAEHLGWLAGQHLERRGPRVHLVACVPDQRAERADRWRRLSLYLPVDLLIAALPGEEPASCDHVELADPSLVRLLETQVAETHLHVGAAIDFGVLWLAILHDLTWGREWRKYENTGDGLHGGREHGQVLMATMVLRHMITAFLWHRTESRERGDFVGFLATWLPRVIRSHARRVDGWSFEDAIAATWGLLHLGAARPVNSAIMRRALQILAGMRRPRIETAHGFIREDPLAQWLSCDPGLARPETRLLQRALRYLRNEGSSDTLFAHGFFQYVRVRNLIYGRLVQTPGTAGLDWFGRHYNRTGHYRGELDHKLFDSALRLNGRGLGLESIEVRTSPWKTVDGNWRIIRSIANQALAQQPVPGRRATEVGLVLHFIKANGSSGHASPQSNVFATRYGRWFNSQWQLAGELARTLEYHPEALLILRGLDMASSELGVPNWPLKPLFERVRHSAARAACELARRQPGWNAAELSTTLHLGEEFRRLNDGLRRVHETVEFGLLRPGDRIGHGLALGWNPESWANTNTCVVQSREDRLDDLLWEIDRYEARQIEPDGGRLAYVRAEATSLANRIYGDGEPSGSDALRHLQDARRQRFDPGLLRRLDYPRRVRGTPSRAHVQLHRYLSDVDVYQRGAELIEVHVDQAEVDFLCRAQRWLRQQLALLGVTIESNPSSNLLIGDFPDLREHPTFRLSPLPGAQEPLDGRLPVSVSTDDPLNFATCLLDEYAHLYFALIGKGVPARDALAWLDHARESGWRSRFTLAASADRECLTSLVSRMTIVCRSPASGL